MTANKVTVFERFSVDHVYGKHSVNGRFLGFAVPVCGETRDDVLGYITVEAPALIAEPDRFRVVETRMSRTPGNVFYGESLGHGEYLTPSAIYPDSEVDRYIAKVVSHS